MAKSIEELDKYISSKIQGVFGHLEMSLLKEEIEKLEPGDVYVEIGTNEGRSARVAHEYADKDVYKLWIDIKDVNPIPGISVGRGDFMEQEGMVGIGKKGFYVHGDGDLFPFILGGQPKKISLLFLDPHHDYESIKSATLAWESLVVKGGVILFHDYDHPETKKWLDEHYGDKKEVFGNKIVRVKV